LSQFAESFEDFGIVSIEQAQDLEVPMLSVMGLDDNDIERLQQALEVHEEEGKESRASEGDAVISLSEMSQGSESRSRETTAMSVLAPLGNLVAAAASPVKVSREVMWRRMVALYAEHNLAKLDEVDNLLDKYEGKYDLIWTKMAEKYGAKAVADAEASAEAAEEDADQDEEADVTPNAKPISMLANLKTEKSNKQKEEHAVLFSAEMKALVQGAPVESLLKKTNEVRPCFVESLPGEGEIHRGLTNKLGQNNCFLNSVVQAFSHLPTFRFPFLEFVPTSAAAGELVVPLQNVLDQFLDGETSALSVTTAPLIDLKEVKPILYSLLGFQWTFMALL
jgi:hypothetical protein